MIKNKFSELTTKLFIKSAVSTKYRIMMVTTYALFAGVMMTVDSSANTYGESQGILKNLGTMIQQAQNTIIGVSSAAAGVGVGTGVFMKKFSMGKQDRIETGNRLIRDSFIGWATINGAVEVLQWLDPYIGAGKNINDIE